jgi:hypothetical protein
MNQHNCRWDVNPDGRLDGLRRERDFSEDDLAVDDRPIVALWGRQTLASIGEVERPVGVRLSCGRQCVPSRVDGDAEIKRRDVALRAEVGPNELRLVDGPCGEQRRVGVLADVRPEHLGLKRAGDAEGEDAEHDRNDETDEGQAAQTTSEGRQAALLGPLGLGRRRRLDQVERPTTGGGRRCAGAERSVGGAWQRAVLHLGLVHRSTDGRVEREGQGRESWLALGQFKIAAMVKGKEGRSRVLWQGPRQHVGRRPTAARRLPKRSERGSPSSTDDVDSTGHPSPLTIRSQDGLVRLLSYR